MCIRFYLDITREPSIVADVSGGMRKISLALCLAAALAVPAGAAAKPTDGDRHAAHDQCKLERGGTSATREAFKATYHSMRRCVLEKAGEEERERGKARSNAARECKAERKDLGRAAFAEKYGENANGKNAFGKCVSTRAKKHKDEMDDDDAEHAAEFRSAAKRCAAERNEVGETKFAEKYGTNANKRNAFGKCVSKRLDAS
jgi:hypothetical protein